MKKMSEPVVFFGNGPVAAKSLKLLAQDFNIETVITKPGPVHHKGDVPVLSLAKDLGLKVETVTDKKSLDQLFSKRPFKSKVGVLIDFGIILSPAVVDYFPLGIVNSHFSILPEWRGADPITFAILSGQRQTGVSLMLLVEAMDEGPLIAYGDYDLAKDITTPALTNDLIDLSHALLANNLPKYLNGELIAVPQSATGRKVSYSRKLSKEDGIIDWTKPAAKLEREIRAFKEWPKSRTLFGSLEVIITGVRLVNISGNPGETVILDKSPVVYCGEHALAIESLKPAGKQEMTGQAFLAGYKTFFVG